MERSEFPLVVDRPRDIEVLGSAPAASALVDAAVVGVSAGLLAALAGWMHGKRDPLAAIVPSLVVGVAAAALSFTRWLMAERPKQGEVFTFWPDRFERSGPGESWIMRYGEMATVRFISRWRVEISSLGGQPRIVRHMVFSFMQRLQEVGAGIVAHRLHQQEIEAGRSVVLREPLGMGGRIMLWVARMGLLGGLVWYCMATYLARETRGAPFDAMSGLMVAAAGAVAVFTVGQVLVPRVDISSEGIRKGSRFLGWSDIERVTSDMDGVKVRPRGQGVALEVTWHCTNAFALPKLLASMVGQGTRVDGSEWASPWQLMGADTVSFEIPDYD